MSRSMEMRLRKIEAAAKPAIRPNVFRSRDERDAAVQAGEFPARAPFCILPAKANSTEEWLYEFAGL